MSATESDLTAAGVDVPAAKADLAAIDNKFGGEKGDIPEQVLRNWVAAHFSHDHLVSLALTLGRKWEKDHVATLPKERAWERDPKFKSKAEYLESQAAAKK